MSYSRMVHLSLLCISICMSALVASSLGEGLPLPKAHAPPSPLEHLDPTLPPVLPGEDPKCRILVLQEDFADTVGCPPASANYTHPPECPGPWTRVVLELSVSASDAQMDRTAAIWLDRVEVLRTTTPKTMVPGAFWRIQKDVTCYTASVQRLADTGGIVSMMLENSNTTFPGVYSANVSLHFYRGAMQNQQAGFIGHPTIKGLYTEPADVVIPLSNPNYQNGFWFRISNDGEEKASVTIPSNAYRAVIEIFASYHGDDALWYTNPLRSSYLQQPQNLSDSKANGGFRQVYATIDGRFVGGRIPYPVIYPGSINPFLWSPVAAIGTFDMPSYDFDVTPFLGLLLDGQPHEFGLGVRDSLSYWLLGANLHLWIDAWSDDIQAALVDYRAPPLKMNRNAQWHSQDGQSEIGAEGTLRFIGWVSSSKGNLTTVIRHKVKFQSQVEVQNRGAVNQVEVSNKERMTVAVQNRRQTIGRVALLVEAPLQLQMSRVNSVGGAEFRKSKLFHQLLEAVELGKGNFVSAASLTDRQDAEGVVLLHNGAPAGGSGTTRSSYNYRDGSVCYSRVVHAAGGIVMHDTNSPSCVAVSDA